MITVMYRDPFKLGSPELRHMRDRMSIAEIVRDLKCLPDGFDERGEVFINGGHVHRDYWSRVRPKPDSPLRPISVTFHMPVQGGDGDSGKQVITIVAAVAISVLTYGAGAGWFSTGGFFTANSVSAYALAASISVVGGLLLNSLAPPPTQNHQVAADNSSDGARLEPSSISGNVLEANASVPHVIGSRRIYPPFISQPFVELIDQDEVVLATYGMAGAHKLSEVKLGDSAIDVPATTVNDINIELREGLATDSSLALNTRQGKMIDYNTRMSVHKVDTENQNTLANTGQDLPVWHGIASGESPDEIWIHFFLSALIHNAAPTTDLRFPIRIRARLRGETEWRNLPELHFKGNLQGNWRAQIKLKFGNPQSGQPSNAPVKLGFVEARKQVPAQNVNPLGEVWDADPYFSNGAGNDSYRSGTEGTTNVTNIDLSADTALIYLDLSEWPKGLYEFELIRGMTIVDSIYNPAAYTVNGNIRDFFGRNDLGTLPTTRGGLVDDLTIVRSVSVWNEKPVSQKNIAVISLRAKNRRVDRLSVSAQGYVNDYGGYLTGVVQGTVSPAANTGSFTETSNASFECNVVLTTIDKGVIWEEGGSAGGSALFVDGDYLILRAGGADSVTSSGTIILSIPTAALPFDGDIHKVAWDIQLDPGRVRLWIDDVFISEEYTLSEGALSTWGGTDGGGYLIANGTVAGNASPASWDATGASSLTVYMGLMDTAGAGWHIQTVTSNPVPHYRAVLSGSLNFDPMPEDIIDDDGLLEWRDACYRNDYQCDLIAEGTRVQELLGLIAACGFARPYQSELWGVVRDYDRSAESPVQIFSPRNSRGLTWEKAFPRLPAGFRVNFANRDLQDKKKQLIVYRRGVQGTSDRLEQVTYDGIVRPAKALDRAAFDLKQAEYRNAIYSQTVPIEAIVCRRGSLVGVQHDILVKQYGYGRIIDVTTSGGNVTAIAIDTVIDVYNNDDMHELADMHAIADMHQVGLKTAIAIRHTDGATSLHPVSNATGEDNTLTLTTPHAVKNVAGSPFDAATVPEIDDGCLVIAGLQGTEYKRMLVTEIKPNTDYTAAMKLVDEAPEIWSN